MCFSSIKRALGFPQTDGIRRHRRNVRPPSFVPLQRSGGMTLRPTNPFAAACRASPVARGRLSRAAVAAAVACLALLWSLALHGDAGRAGRRADRRNLGSARPRRREGEPRREALRRSPAFGKREARLHVLPRSRGRRGRRPAAQSRQRRPMARFQCSNRFQRGAELPAELARQLPRLRSPERGGVARSADHGVALARAATQARSGPGIRNGLRSGLRTIRPS